jgi:hypothetical protein
MGNWGSKRTAAEPPPPPPKPAPVARVTRAPAQPQINRGYYDDYLTEHQRILERRETLERQRVLLDQYAGNHRPTAAAIHVNHNPPVQNATPEPPTLYQGMLERLTTIEQQRVLLDQYAANRRPTATAIHVDHNPPVQNATPTPDPPTLYQRPAVHSPATPTTPSENVGPSRPISRAPRPPFVPKETPVQSCRFFLRGRCKYGESCNQPHVAVRLRTNPGTIFDTNYGSPRMEKLGCKPELLLPTVQKRPQLSHTVVHGWLAIVPEAGGVDIFTIRR